MTQATPTYGWFYDPNAVGSVLYVCAKFEADSSIRSKVIIYGGSQNFEIWSRDLGHANLGVILWFAQGCDIYVCAKFEADISIRSKVIRVPKFRNWVT